MKVTNKTSHNNNGKLGTSLTSSCPDWLSQSCLLCMTYHGQPLPASPNSMLPTSPKRSIYLALTLFDSISSMIASSPVTPPPTDVFLPDQKFLCRFQSHVQPPEVPPQALVDRSNFGPDHQKFLSLLCFEHSVSRRWWGIFGNNTETSLSNWWTALNYVFDMSSKISNMLTYIHHIIVLSPFKNSTNKNSEHLMNSIKLCISYEFQNIEYAHLYTSHYRYYHHSKTAQIKMVSVWWTALNYEFNMNSKIYYVSVSRTALNY